MTTNLLIAGFGGQGVMTIGKMIGECAFAQNLNVTFLPSYGPEQRGGRECGNPQLPDYL